MKLNVTKSAKDVTSDYIPEAACFGDHRFAIYLCRMTNDQLIHIANQWFDAFNKKDIEALLSLYHENAEHYSPKLKVRQPETNGLIKGKAAMRAWWLDAFHRLPSLRYEVIRLTPYEDRVFMEYVRKVTGEGELYVGEMLEIENGLIKASAVFHR